METRILDGKKIRKEILEEIKKEVASLDFKPVFCDVLVGGNKVSAQYVRMKSRVALSLGISFHSANFPETISTSELVEEIQKINLIPNMCGVIVQLPLPEHLDSRLVLDAISPELDVDCLGSVQSAKFYAGDTSLGYPTALACMVLLDSIDLDLSRKNIVALGQGTLVGKPVSALLSFRGLDPIRVNRYTENKEEIIKNADVIISGIGKGKHVTKDMIKEGVVLIDAGTSEKNSNIVGDVDLESVAGVASVISPVPGGVGPVTVAMLFMNVLKVAKSKNHKII